MTRTRLFALLSACSALFLFAPDADARSGRQSQVPNGLTFNCETCHTSPTGGAGLNAFGQDVNDSGLTSMDAAGMVTWSTLYDIDSDGDGDTNGAELGDPDGTWTIGAADPDVTPTNPGVDDSGGDGDGDGDGDTDGGTGDGDMDMGGCSSQSVPAQGAPLAALGVIVFGAALVRRRRD